jgi:NADPH-dependent 2,4-dienoyl-CoA reductase/sulfur reductase-like enzyme
MSSTPSGDEAPVVIVGASLAGLNCARELREAGYEGALTIVDRAPHMPYDRPPLSKQYLSGSLAEENLYFDVADLGRVTWMLETEAVSLDAGSRCVTLSSGEKLSFTDLVIATGACPRTISGHDLEGAILLRTLDDARRLRSLLSCPPRPRVVVVGGGFIGCEIASTGKQMGLEVTVVDSSGLLFEDLLGPEVADVITNLHDQHGVDLRLGRRASRLLGESRVEAVELADGEILPAEVVVLALGVSPETEWLSGSGLTLDDGVLTDGALEAAPHIYAAGDVARYPSALRKEHRRVEHWDNAIQTGRHAAQSLLARRRGHPTEAFDDVPWVWSDQHRTKLQVIGSPRGCDEVALVNELDETGRFLALYRKDDVLAAGFGIKRTKTLMDLKSEIGQPHSWERAVRACIPSAILTENEPAA